MNKKPIAYVFIGLIVGVVVTFVSVAKIGQSSSGTQYIVPSQAIDHLGQIQTVRFDASSTHTDYSGTEFLDQFANYKSGFVVTIFQSNLQNYQFDPASKLLGKTIDVRGYIQLYNGYIEILNPISISVVQ